MGNGKSALKVFVDEKKKKVMFAEAEEDFVEILFSFFTLPLGTIARLSTKYTDSKDDHPKVGSLTSLYESVMNLDARLFSEMSSKVYLVNPINSSAPIFQKLKVNLDDMAPFSYQHGEVFLKKKAKFIITDDLKVIPVVLDTSIKLLNSLGVDYIDSLQERTIYFGSKEFLNLLKWSLMTNNPLTNLLFEGSKPKPCSTFLKTSTLSDSKKSGKTQRVKLLVQKSKEKVLCAQVENRFVELLFSFLTIPLGTFVRLTKGDSSPLLGISNLYQSVSSLGEGDYFKSEDVKKILLCPKVSSSYSRVTNLLPIYEVGRKEGAFLKEQATFIVSEDLKVTTSPSIATLSKFNIPGVPIGDMELLELSIGEQEAVLLLKASLDSTSALTDWLKVVRKKPKDHVPNIAFAGDGGKDSAYQKEADFILETQYNVRR